MRGKPNEVPKKYSLNSSNLTDSSRKKLSSFEKEFPENSEENEGCEIKPLTTKFYSNLLRLEEKVFSKNFDIDTLNEIVSLYAVFSSLYSLIYR